MGNFFIETIWPLLIGIGSGLFTAYIVLRAKVFIRLAELAGDLPSWELLYEHDENGEPITGGIEKLIDAAGKAYPIKVKLFPAGEFDKGERFEVFNADLVFAEPEPDQKLVTALNTTHISMERKPNGERIFQDPAYHMYILANTKGIYFTARYFLNGEKKYSKSMNRHMTWYGLVPPSRN